MRFLPWRGWLPSALALTSFGAMSLLAPAAAPPPARALANSVGMRLVPVPAGKFLMGSPAAEKERDPGDEGPQREVEFGKPFYLGAYEVTQAQYQKVMGRNPSYYSAEGGGKDKVKGLDADKLPVESVSWEEAVEFCDKLSALPEEKKAGRTYRLPTEAEWEYACRAGSATPFAFGKALTAAQANVLNDPGRPQPVGSYKANSWGLYDMHGNVWEWCHDWYAKDYYKVGPKKGRKGPEKGAGRVVRGAAFDAVARQCRSAYRTYNAPAFRNTDLGFRVVCEFAR